MQKKGGGRFHEYNTEMDKNFGKRDLDPDAKARAKLRSQYDSLFGLKCLYIWGDPGSGKSFLADCLHASMDLGDAKKKLHYNEFMLEVHQMEHKVN